MASEEITRLLVSIREGDKHALNQLLPLVYRELHSMAHRTLGHGSGDATLNTTALVHEAYLKLHDRTALSLQDRKHFYSVAAMAMRQIVIDHARRRQAQKRGGEFRKVDLEAADLPIRDGSQEILALDEALLRLSKLDARMGRVVELRFFGGLSVEETAEVLDVDPRTVKRDWRKARAILYAALQGNDEGPQDAA
jgi:RNA polymerase sigma factor (TIGR02999 family)